METLFCDITQQMQPDISEIVKNWAEVAAVFVGGLWVLWLFLYERRSHAPSLDGDLSIESVAISNEVIAVSVRAVWNNRNKFPLELDKTGCSVLVFKMDAKLPKGSVLPQDGAATHRYDYAKNSILEQGTQSVLRAHFVLDKGPVYFFRWNLKSTIFWDWLLLKRNTSNWVKEIIWDSSTSAR